MDKLFEFKFFEMVDPGAFTKRNLMIVVVSVFVCALSDNKSVDLNHFDTFNNNWIFSISSMI